MRNLKSLILLITSIFCLSSCSIDSSKINLFDKVNDDKQASARLEQVIVAINNQDKEALKSLFSVNVLNEADAFSNNMDDLFDFIQGKLDSWETANSLTVFESVNNDTQKKEVSSYYYVTTQNEKYFFLMEECTIDTAFPENVGLCLLLVVKAEDHYKIYDEKNKIIYDTIIENGQEKIVKLSHTGIYIPLK